MVNLSLYSLVFFFIICQIYTFGVPSEWGISNYNSWKDSLLKGHLNKTDCVFFRKESILICLGYYIFFSFLKLLYMKL